jgi:DNA-binding transcriptional LysR family regulator
VNNRSGECGKERQHECIASPVEGFRCGGAPKSFTRAAAELGLTQSAISRSVRELEEEIDQRLFDRTTRQVELTDAGEMLSQRICHLIEEVEQTLRDSHGTGKPCEGTVQIATDPVLSSMTLPMWVAGCRKAWPGIGITLRDRSHECVLQSVRSGEVDFGIASNPAPCDDLYCEPLCVDPLQAVLPAGIRWPREVAGVGRTGDASVLTLDQSSGQPAVERALATYRVDRARCRCWAICRDLRHGGDGAGHRRGAVAGAGQRHAPRRAATCASAGDVQRHARAPQGRSLKPNAAAVWDNLRAQEYDAAIC